MWVEVQINKIVKLIERVVVQNNEIMVGTNIKTFPALRFMQVIEEAIIVTMTQKAFARWFFIR